MLWHKNWLPLALLACIVSVISVSGPLPAQQDSGGKSFVKNLDIGLRDVINHGAAIYNNQGDYAGCYRLFQGALVSVKPLLGSYPELQKRIDSALAEAKIQPRMQDRAHALRKTLDEIRNVMNPSAAAADKDIAKQPNQGGKIQKAQTLWDRLGGEKGVTKVLSDLFESAAADPKVDFTRGGKYPLTPDNVRVLQKSVLDFVSNATGGPYKYTGQSMQDAHKGMGITNEQFDAFASHLKSALEKNGVMPSDVAIVLGAVGGTRQAIVEPISKNDPDKKDKR